MDSDTQAFEKHFDEWAAQNYEDEADRRKQSWILDAVRAYRRWGQGREVSRSDFETAVREVLGLQLGGGPPPERAQ